MELEESTCLTSDYTKKLVIRTVWYRPKDRNIDQNMEQNRKPRDKSMHLWTPLTEEARIYNGKKTNSLTSGAGNLVNHL